MGPSKRRTSRASDFVRNRPMPGGVRFQYPTVGFVDCPKETWREMTRGSFADLLRQSRPVNRSTNLGRAYQSGGFWGPASPQPVIVGDVTPEMATTARNAANIFAKPYKVAIWHPGREKLPSGRAAHKIDLLPRGLLAHTKKRNVFLLRGPDDSRSGSHQNRPTKRAVRLSWDSRTPGQSFRCWRSESGLRWPTPYAEKKNLFGQAVCWGPSIGQRGRSLWSKVVAGRLFSSGRHGFGGAHVN